MLGSNRLCSLELDDDFSFNEKVGIELANDSFSKVNMERILALHSKSFVLDSDRQGFLINGFKKTSSQLIDDFECTTDDFLSDVSIL